VRLKIADQRLEKSRGQSVREASQQRGQAFVLKIFLEDRPVFDLAEHHRVPNLVAFKKRDELFKFRRAEPLEGVGLPFEFVCGRASQSGDRAKTTAPFYFRQSLEGKIPPPSDQTYSRSHASVAFLTNPRLAERTKAKISSRSSDGGNSASIRSSAWVVFNPWNRRI
jgi:hypothetical protein